MATTTAITARLASEHRGCDYRSPEWAAAAEAGSWCNVWPEIDRDGHLTGRLVDSGDDGDWLNVEDEAMIHESEARLGSWRIDREEGRARPSEWVAVEIATANETIRDAIGATLECTCLEEACDAYHEAAATALDADSRAHRLCSRGPIGSRALHCQWCGAHWGAIYGAVATMARDLTNEEKAALSAADDAGRAAAAAVIEEDRQATADE